MLIFFVFDVLLILIIQAIHKKMCIFTNVAHFCDIYLHMNLITFHIVSRQV